MSRIIVKSTNLPSNGTTNDVGGIISANRRKNTVSDNRIDMLSDTCVFASVNDDEGMKRDEKKKKKFN